MVGRAHRRHPRSVRVSLEHPLSLGGDLGRRDPAPRRRARPVPAASTERRLGGKGMDANSLRQSPPTAVSRRAFLTRMAAVAAGLPLLAACAPTAPSAAPTSKPAAPAPAPTSAPADATSAPTTAPAAAAKPAESKPAAAAAPANTPAPAANTPAPAAATQAQPKSGGTLRAATVGEFV